MTEHEIFEGALERVRAADRIAFLRAACGSDEALRLRIDGLLAAHEGAGSFMAEPAAGPPATMMMPSIAETAGTPVGPYKLLQLIGEGGFGVVYMAEQSIPVRRKVALKIIKPGMDTREVVARFQSERQALALMDHPNIARVLDAGATESGRPYFVMELVKGVPITEFCDKNHLPVEKRLDLFMDVCRAVQHAHQKGIIHRDLKPSNVMVTLHDGTPVPKVIDFGVAKATSQQLTQRTLFTAYGQMIGTPVYMSPEQAEMSGLDIDTRSDIYSLGVLLYELLTGTTPLEMERLRTAGFVEMQRLIRDEEPQRPSTRLSTMGGQATVLAENRSTDVKKLGQLLSGDLDWIVMKALEKERSRRYETPGAFAADLRRFLSHEPIVARPPSTVYRLRKLVQRNKLAVAATSAVAVALVSGTVASTWFGLDALEQRDRARDAEVDLGISLQRAQDEQRRAETERDRANKATEAEAKSAAIAEERRKEADAARIAADEQKTAAERERDQAQRLRDEANELNEKLRLAAEEQRRAIYATEMNLLRIEAQRGNLQQMRSILMRQLPIHGEEDLRGFEWWYWYRHLHQAKVLLHVENFRYGESDSALAIVPGGKLAAVTRGKESQLLKVPSGEVAFTWPANVPISVRHSQYASDGATVLGLCDPLGSFSPTSSRPRARAQDCTYYSPTTGARRLTYPSDPYSHVSSLAISRDARFVAAIGNDLTHERDKPACRLIVFDTASGEVLLNHLATRELNRVEFSADGSRVAAYVCIGTKRGTDAEREVIMVFDVATGQELAVARLDDDVDGVFWLPGGDRLLLTTVGWSGTNRKELLTWTVNEGPPVLLSREYMPDHVRGSVSPDGRLVAVGGHTTSSIRLIDTQRGDVVDTLHNEAAPIERLTFSEDSQQLIACSTSGDVLSWDLGANADLFALRTKPLGRLSFDGYTVSDDQTLLATAGMDGSVLVRKRSGEELVLRSPLPDAVPRMSMLRFSGDRRYLAHLSNVGEDGKRLESRDSRGRRAQQCLLELYDLHSGQKKWHVIHPNRLAPEHVRLEFGADSKQLVILEGYHRIVMDCESGVARARSGEDSLVMTTGLIRNVSSGRLLFAGLLMGPQRPETRAIIGDALTGESPYEAELPVMADGRTTRSSLPGIVHPSPDGEHVAVIRDQQATTEVWNLKSGARILSAPGPDFDFSPDGSRVAIGQRERNSLAGQTGALPQLSTIRVFEVANGSALCEVNLRGNEADACRLSPDSRRLLTMHGKTATGSGGTIAQGRLWDIASGREILAMPVADVNHYVWDLHFDTAGTRLESLLLSKALGTGGGGNSVAYDARPLGEEDDAKLIAGHLVENLKQLTPLPAEMRTEVESRSGLKPLVRDFALEQIKRLSTNSDSLADAILECVNRSSRNRSDYERALRWAESLHAGEPDSLRSRVLLAAVQYRLGRMQDALALVTRAESSPGASETPVEPKYEQIRLAIEILARHQADKDGSATELVASLTRELIGSTYQTNPLSRPPIVMEAVLTQPLVNVGVASIRTPTLTAEEVDKNLRASDRNVNGIIEESELPPGLWRQLLAYDEDRDDRIMRVEFTKYLQDYAEVAKPIETVTQVPAELARQILDEVIRRTPHYPAGHNARAWLLATSSDDRIRKGQQAVKDAMTACELTRWKLAEYVETLAAAHAEAGNFDEAVKRQSQAIEMTAGDEAPARQQRLALYRDHKPLRIKNAAQQTRAMRLEGGRSLESRSYSAPLLSPELVAKSRRIPGWCSCWSPEGGKLVRNESMQVNGNESNLSIIDLKTGESTVLCLGGVDPSWSTQPDGPIAFVRGAEGKAREFATEEVWLVNPDGSNLRKVATGGFPFWTADGRLFFRSVAADKSSQLHVVTPASPDVPAQQFPLQGGYPAMSRDGQLVVMNPPGQLQIHRPGSDKPQMAVSLDPGERGLSDFSPDGRYVAYGSWDRSFAGVLLIEVASGKTRLLSNLAGTMPRWSPDGRFIAVDERAKNEIVILDVSSLDLNSIFERTPAPPTPSVQAPSASAAP